MMNGRWNQNNLDERPALVTERLELMTDDQKFRLRAILIEKDDANWGAKVIILQGFQSGISPPEKVSSINLGQLVLHETWLTPVEVIQFLEQIDEGRISIANQSITLDEQQRWSLRQTFTNSHYVEQAGIIVDLSLPKERELRGEAFLEIDSGTYFPDENALINYWLPFSSTYGDRDGRMGSFHLIIPEERAYFVSADETKEFIEVEVAGTELQGEITLAAAIMSDQKMTHSSQKVEGTNLQIPVSAGTTSWDIVLYTKAGEILDSWTNRYNPLGQAMTANGDFEENIRAALEQGEGPKIEFKPFVNLPSNVRGQKQTKTGKNKFTEILQAICAMSNTEGGRVFLGISDHLEFNTDPVILREWAQSAWNAENLESYRKALLASLNDRLIISAPVSASCGVIDDAPVIIISIPSSREYQPAHIREDTTLWVRRGASNMKLAPSEWHKITPQHNLIAGSLGLQPHWR